MAYGEQRDLELYEAYKAALPLHRREDGTIDSMAAIETAVHTPCSRFWISEEIAACNIRKILKNPNLLKKMMSNKRKMYTELIGVYKKMRSDPKYSDLTDRQVAYLASDTPASEFYMTTGSALVRICHVRKSRHEKDARKKYAKKILDKRPVRPLIPSQCEQDNIKKQSEDIGKKKEGLLPHWTKFRPRPLNWHIKKRVRTPIQYVIRWEESRN